MIINLRDKRQQSQSVRRLTLSEIGHQPGISVIMAFDEAAYPHLKSLLSALIQTNVSEWILIDMGTSPDIQETLATIAEETNQVVLLQTEKMSVTTAWQLGVEKAKGEYLLFLEPSFALSVNALSQALQSVSYISESGPWVAGFTIKEGDIKSPACTSLDDPKHALSRLLRWKRSGDTTSFQLARNYHFEPLWVSGLAPSALFIKRSDYWSIGGLDNRLTLAFAANDLALKTHAQGGHVYCFPEVHLLPIKSCVKHTTLSHIMSCIRYYEKHYRKTFSVWIRYALYTLFGLHVLAKDCQTRTMTLKETIQDWLKRHLKR